MEGDPFGDLMDWGKVVEKLEGLSKAGKLVISTVYPISQRVETF